MGIRLPEEQMQRVLAGENPMGLASEAVAPSEASAAASGEHSMACGMNHEMAVEGDAEALAHRNYPWAKEILTADGHIKCAYNIKHGTVLQPLPQVTASLAASRRKEAFANPRNGTGTNYL